MELAYSLDGGATYSSGGSWQQNCSSLIIPIVDDAAGPLILQVMLYDLDEIVVAGSGLVVIVNV